jgi:predicted secreted protein
MALLKTNRFWLILLILLPAFWGCEIPTKTTINGKEVWIDKRLRVNGTMSITKKENFTTPYRLEVEYDKEYLDYLGKEYRTHQQPGDRRVGVGGTSTFTFRALKPGLTKIILKNRHLAEPKPYTEETVWVQIY